MKGGHAMRIAIRSLVLAVALLLPGCAYMTDTERRVTTGTMPPSCSILAA